MVASKVPLTCTALVLAALFVGTTASAATINVSSCAQADVQSAIDRAVDGDVVAIPAGRCTWSAPIVLVNKDIHVQGAGTGQTVITSNQEFIFYVGISNAAKGSFRVSNMTLTGNVTNAVFQITSGSLAAVPSGRWRIDHIHFDMKSGYRDAVRVGRGVNYGVIDHNVFDWFGSFIVRHQFGLDSENTQPGNYATWAGNFSSSLPLDLGTDKFVFVEDNIINSYRTDGSPLWVYDSSGGGGRVVFRYNTVTGGQFYNHWTRGREVSAQAMEIYNNTWLVGSSPMSTFDPQAVFRIEGGTGVFFNNYSNYNNGAPFVTLDDRRSGGFGGPVGTEADAGTWGLCDGRQPWDGNAGDPSAPGWPCMGQIGRAPGISFVALASGTAKQASAPFYIWNNGPDPGCATGGACTNTVKAWVTPVAYIKNTPHPNGAVDYVDNNTPKPGYSPYAYPHPLVSGSGAGSSSSSSAPAPPTNVRIVSGS